MAKNYIYFSQDKNPKRCQMKIRHSLINKY
ncbi:hypothetical protein Patl1_18521 [Pistacia atlantica]|uniref:Uncharacterized protein n=1 Tax=Pistacia atlantica TaxID=434234 RepID=A0ACC1BYP5_9ROSI|nr:hypothetical protein Patl1_18521 [Pistacia atlantica]